MSLKHELSKGSVVRKQVVTLGPEEGFGEPKEVEVWGLMLGERQKVYAQGYDAANRPKMDVLYPLVLRKTCHNPLTGERVWDDSPEDSALLEEFEPRAADKLFLVAFEILGFGGNAAKNGLEGGENLSISSPSSSDGEA